MNVNTPIPTNQGHISEKFGEIWKKQVEAIQIKFGAAIEEVRWPGSYPTDVPILYVKKEKIVEVLEFAKLTPGLEYGFLSDLTATDEEFDPRFEIVYNLLSHSNMARIRFKVRVSEGAEVPTVISVWKAANWAEREVFDMFGVKFSGHPDLRRILMDERWVGHPLRKDYPLRGYQIFPDSLPPQPDLLKD